MVLKAPPALSSRSQAVVSSFFTLSEPAMTQEGCWLGLIGFGSPRGTRAKAVRRWPALLPAGSSAESVSFPSGSRLHGADGRRPASAPTCHPERRPPRAFVAALPASAVPRVVRLDRAPVLGRHRIVAERLPGGRERLARVIASSASSGLGFAARCEFRLPKGQAQPAWFWAAICEGINAQ